MSQNLNPPPFKDPVDQGSRGGLMSTWHAWFSQLFKWLQTLAANNTGINTGDQTNITGTAANLSGTPALPDGTTATTQANGDSSTKLANDAFVQAALTYYNAPVAWDGSTDRVLGVGQHTSDSFTAATSMPLHIACGDGQEYELSMVGTFTPVAPTAGTFLLINNTTLAGNFRRNTLFLNSATSVSGLNTTAADTGFLLVYGSSPYQAKFTLWTSTLYKAINGSSKGQETTNGIRGNEKIMIESTDTTTLYLSLGTITMPNAWTGQIVVRRVA